MPPRRIPAFRNVIGHRAAPNSTNLQSPSRIAILLFYHLYIMVSLSKEKRVQLALKASKKGQYRTQKAASLVFDAPETTLQRWLQGTTLRYQGLTAFPVGIFCRAIGPTPPPTGYTI